MLKKAFLFSALLGVLTVFPASLPTRSQAMTQNQMVMVQGSGAGCDFMSGLSVGLGIGGLFGCGPCGVASLVLGGVTLVAC